MMMNLQGLEKTILISLRKSWVKDSNKTLRISRKILRNALNSWEAFKRAKSQVKYEA